MFKQAANQVKHLQLLIEPLALVLLQFLCSKLTLSLLYLRPTTLYLSLPSFLPACDLDPYLFIENFPSLARV